MDREEIKECLETITSLKIGDKLGVNEGLYISPNFFSRYWKGEDRMNTVNRLESFYDNLIPMTVEDSDLSHLLWRSLHGIERMKETYKDDITTVERINCLLKEVKRKKIELAQEHYNKLLKRERKSKKRGKK